MGAGEAIAEDYASVGLSLRGHPLALLRPALEAGRGRARPPLVPASQLSGLAAGARVAVAGLVIVRQRPGTARGVVFVTIEDEAGAGNLIVRPAVFERHRRAVLAARLLVAEGRRRRRGGVVHLVAERLAERTDLLCRLGEPGAPFRPPLARVLLHHLPGRDPSYPSSTHPCRVLQAPAAHHHEPSLVVHDGAVGRLRDGPGGLGMRLAEPGNTSRLIRISGSQYLAARSIP